MTRRWLGLPVVVVDSAEKKVWWGRIEEVELTLRAIARSWVLKDVVNRYQVVYTLPSVTGRGESQVTAWVQDDDSVSRYGIHEQRRSMSDVTAAQVIVTNGGKHAVYETCTTLFDPGDEVLLPAPYWTTYPEPIRLAGGVPVVLPTDVVVADKLDAAEMQKLVATPKGGAASQKSGGFRDVTGGGTVRVGTLRVNDLTMNNIRAACALDRGVIRLDPVESQFAGGTQAGSITIDTRGEHPAVFSFRCSRSSPSRACGRSYSRVMATSGGLSRRGGFRL